MAGPVRTASAAESITNSALMAAAGGFLDAFTYVGHGHVFANAMTGNVVLLAVALGVGEWNQALRHLVPIFAFGAGIAAARLLHERPFSNWIASPHLGCMVAETMSLFVVGWLPLSFPDLWLTLGIAFVASLQLATFATVRGVAYASTFTTGNLFKFTRSLMTMFYQPRDLDARFLTLTFALICSAFFAGAAAGAVSTRYFSNHAAWLVAAWLAFATWRLAATAAPESAVPDPVELRAGSETNPRRG